MSATAVSYSNQTDAPRFPFKALFGILVLAALLLGTHAVIRHGAGAEAVRKCIDNGGGIELWANKITQRQAEICQMPPDAGFGIFGIQISRFGREVTSFPKEKLTRLEQVRKYLENRGYERLYP